MKNVSGNLILLDKEKIKKNINADIAVDILEKIGSTNDYLKNDSEKNNKICIAEMQTQGRGRFNRQWHSPFGQNIYFSMRYAFEKDISELSGLSLVVGLAVSMQCQARLPCLFCKIKWPNDIFVGKQKIAGILIDVNAESRGLCHAIIGIGINVNMEEVSQNQIDQPWTSLQKITGQYIDRNLLCAALINTLTNYLERFSKLGLSDFMNDWKEKDYLWGESVSILSGQKKLTGIANGINAQGHLILKMPDKTKRTVSSGDATLLSFTHNSI